MKRHSIIILVLICLIAASQSLFPLDVEFPLIQSLSYFPYWDNQALEQGDFSLSLDMYYSNTYVFDNARTIISDLESSSNVVGFRYGLTDRLTLEAFYRVTFYFGGFLDSVIIGFHDLFGLKVGGRDAYPQDLVQYSFRNYFSYKENQTVSSPLIAGLVGNIYEDDYFFLNARVAVGIPLESTPGFSSNRPFLTGGLMMRYTSGDFALDVAGHASFFKTPDWLLREEMDNHILTSELRLRYKCVFGGVLWRSTPFQTGDLSNPAYLAYIGVNITDYLEFSLIEEFPPMDTTSDVTFRLKFNIVSAD
jgi:hypothetical protein